MTTDTINTETELLATIRTGDWLDAQVFGPLQWAVHGVIPEGMGLLTGAPKAGKSWCALDIALAVASGGHALGKIHTGRARPVLMLALEDGERRLQGRCRKLLGDGEPIPELLYFVTATRPDHVIPLIRAWLAEHGQDNPLVILDTLGKVMPPSMAGESAYARDYRIGGVLKSLVDEHPGSTLLVVHHVRKASGEDWMDSTSGTNGLNGAADFTINLHRERNSESGVLRVTGRDVGENEYAVTVRDGQWALDGTDLMAAAQAAEVARVTAGVGDRMAEVVGWVNLQKAAVTPAMVGAALGIDADDAGQYLRRAVKAERLRKASRGYYLPLSEVSEVSESGNVSYLPTADPDAHSDTPSDSPGMQANRSRRSEPYSDSPDTSDTGGDL